MKEMEKRNDKLILLMLLIPVIAVFIAAGCHSKNNDSSQPVVTSVTKSEETIASESLTESESAVPDETETEETESETENTAKPTPTATAKKTTKGTKNTTKKKSTTSAKKKYSKYVFVGDSRTVGLDDAVSGISSIAKVGVGVDYLRKVLKTVTKIRGKNVIFNFGVNDLGNVNKYITVYKSLPKDFIKNNNVIIMSVNPTSGKYKSWNKDIDKFNKKIRTNLPSGVKYLNTNSVLKREGFSTRDGLHYTAKTYRRIAKITFSYCGDKNRKV